MDCISSSISLNLSYLTLEVFCSSPPAAAGVASFLAAGAFYFLPPGAGFWAAWFADCQYEYPLESTRNMPPFCTVSILNLKGLVVKIYYL